MFITSLPYFVFAAYALIVLWCFWWLARNAGRVHRTLDGYMRLAERAVTPEELEVVRIAVREYVRRNCWHRQHVSHAREVLSYISGRLHF